MTIEALVKKFAASVAGQSNAVREGDIRAGNEFADSYIAAFKELRAHGDKGRRLHRC
jgi:hypothetical protein